MSKAARLYNVIVNRWTHSYVIFEHIPISRRTDTRYVMNLKCVECLWLMLTVILFKYLFHWQSICASVPKTPSQQWFFPKIKHQDLHKTLEDTLTVIYDLPCFKAMIYFKRNQRTKLWHNFEHNRTSGFTNFFLPLSEKKFELHFFANPKHPTLPCESPHTICGPCTQIPKLDLQFSTRRMIQYTKTVKEGHEPHQRH